MIIFIVFLQPKHKEPHRNVTVHAGNSLAIDSPFSSSSSPLTYMTHSTEVWLKIGCTFSLCLIGISPRCPTLINTDHNNLPLMTLIWKGFSCWLFFQQGVVPNKTFRENGWRPFWFYFFVFFVLSYKIVWPPRRDKCKNKGNIVLSHSKGKRKMKTGRALMPVTWKPMSCCVLLLFPCTHTAPCVTPENRRQTDCRRRFFLCTGAFVCFSATIMTKTSLSSKHTNLLLGCMLPSEWSGKLNRLE